MKKAGDPVTEAVGTGSREHERRLISRAQSRDPGAMRELIDLHKDRLFAFIWRMIRNHHDAEEVCQDAFLKAFASLDTFSVEYRFSTWLFTIGYRLCLNRMRRKRTQAGEVDLASLSLASEADSTAALESEEAGRLRQMVWEAVDQLTSPQRATVLLFYRQELSCQEVARVLELPVATVKSHLHRARNRLRVVLESLGEQELHEFRNLSGQAG